jgi:hypothetical protein
VIKPVFGLDKQKGMNKILQSPLALIEEDENT